MEIIFNDSAPGGLVYELTCRFPYNSNSLFIHLIGLNSDDIRWSLIKTKVNCCFLSIFKMSERKLREFILELIELDEFINNKINGKLVISYLMGYNGGLHKAGVAFFITDFSIYNSIPMEEEKHFDHRFFSAVQSLDFDLAREIHLVHNIMDD